MNVKKIMTGDTLTVIIDGRIDTNTAPELLSEIEPSLNDISALVLDFKGVNYVSSAGLRVLLSLHKAMSAKGGMKLLNVTSEVNDVFEITGFSEILNYEKGES